MFKLKPLSVLVPAMLGASVAANAADTGDAPASYGLATHEVVSGAPYIGELAPDNNTPVNSVAADGDDTDVDANGNVLDDEDGIFAHPQLVQNGKSYQTNVFVSNPSSSTATLVGWVDFDGNGLFDTDEAVTGTVPPGADNLKIKLIWPDLAGLSTDFYGASYGRYRITTGAITAGDALGNFADGEVEDYPISILQDTDGDEIPDSADLDNDNDGIPDSVEQTGIDTDNDGTPNYLDVDSDDDSIPDYIEAGANALVPVDSDGDSQPDYLDLDSNNDNVPDSAGIAGDADRDGIPDSIEGSGDSDGDGILDRDDIDADNDVIPDAVEAGDNPATPLDSDNDGVADYLDIDSDNDGLPDIRESNTTEISIDKIDTDNSGRADSTFVFGSNGFVDDIETQADTGVPIYAIPDSDGDGVRDFRDSDSDNDGAADVVEVGGADVDNNGVVDGLVDTDGDGIPDVYDVSQTGGADTDFDQVDDIADTDFVSGVDADGDGVLDVFDIDDNGDGLVDGTTNTLLSDGTFVDLDNDTVPDYRDPDSIADGTAGTTAGNTTGGTTTGGNTTGGTTTAGTTTGGTTGTGSESPVIETGLSGGIGCSVGESPARDPWMLALVLASLPVLFRRRLSRRLARVRQQRKRR